MVLHLVTRRQRARRILGVVALLAAFACFWYGFAFTAMGLILMGCLAMRSAPVSAKPGPTFAGANVPEGQWIRDPTNLTSPYGDYDPPSQ